MKEPIVALSFKVAALMLVSFGVLAAIESAPQYQDGSRWYLLDDMGSIQRELAFDELMHGDHALFVRVSGGRVARAYTCRLETVFPGTISTLDARPITPEQAGDFLSQRTSPAPL